MARVMSGVAKSWEAEDAAGLPKNQYLRAVWNIILTNQHVCRMHSQYRVQRAALHDF